MEIRTPKVAYVYFSDLNIDAQNHYKKNKDINVLGIDSVSDKISLRVMEIVILSIGSKRKLLKSRW